jgi:hypothetical protein
MKQDTMHGAVCNNCYINQHFLLKILDVSSRLDNSVC